MFSRLNPVMDFHSSSLETPRVLLTNETYLRHRAAEGSFLTTFLDLGFRVALRLERGL